MEDLTKDSYTLLCIMYHIYLDRVKAGMSKSESREFADGFYKANKNLAKRNPNDIELSLKELSAKGYIKINIWDDSTFTDKAIIKMEKRFVDKGKLITEILSYLPGYIFH